MRKTDTDVVTIVNTVPVGVKRAGSMKGRMRQKPSPCILPGERHYGNRSLA